MRVCGVLACGSHSGPSLRGEMSYPPSCGGPETTRLEVVEVGRHDTRVDVSRHAHELVMSGRDAPFEFCRFAKTAYSILRNEFACHVTGRDFRHCTPFLFLMCDFVESRVRVSMGYILVGRNSVSSKFWRFRDYAPGGLWRVRQWSTRVR